ncbi:MAG: hypothetical protein K6A43_08105 [Treponema sp.]|nr:hypothetical protein [Treponema sp.]
MEVCEEIISYPFVKYKVNVSHVTSRNSTAFEWLFLEILIKSSGTEFQNENLEDFFKNYFHIENPEKLIKPILKKLYDLQAVTCPKLTDDILLSELTLKDVEVLSLGREMQQKGLLPGEHSNDMLDVVYDVSKNKLIWDREKFSDEAEGNYVSVEETPFPKRLVREYIESQRPKNENLENSEQGKGKKKKQKKLDWLKNNTEIDSVLPIKIETCFDNISCKVQLKDGLIWKIEGNKVTELEESSLENFENTPLESLVKCPLTEISKPDEQIQQIILFNDLNNRIQSYLKNDTYKTFLIESSLFDKEKLVKKSDTKNKKSDKKQSLRIVILSNSQNFSISSENAIFVLSVPERILPPNIIFMNETFSLNVEKFPVKAGDVSKELTFAYLPKNVKPNTKNFILPLVEKYFRTEPSVLLLLNEENGFKNEFNSYFEKLVSNGSVKDKSEKINELNQRSFNLTGKKCVSDEIVFNLIINKEQIKQSVTDFSSARKIIEYYSSISIVKNQVLRDFLKIVLESLQPTDSVEEIWKLIEFIKNISFDSVGFLDKQRVIGKLYSEQAKNDVFKKAFSEKLEGSHCDLEKRALDFASLLKKINSESDEKKLKDALNTWKTNFGNLKNCYGTIEIVEKYNCQINSRIAELKKTNNGGKNI